LIPDPHDHHRSGAEIATNISHLHDDLGLAAGKRVVAVDEQAELHVWPRIRHESG